MSYREPAFVCTECQNKKPSPKKEKAPMSEKTKKTLLMLVVLLIGLFFSVLMVVAGTWEAIEKMPEGTIAGTIVIGIGFVAGVVTLGAVHIYGDDR